MTLTNWQSFPDSLGAYFDWGDIEGITIIPSLDYYQRSWTMLAAIISTLTLTEFPVKQFFMYGVSSHPMGQFIGAPNRIATYAIIENLCRSVI